MADHGRGWQIHLYAVVSADDCIADANGNMPKSLMNDADWQYFQRELDSCALVILGRHSHLAVPNAAKRHRVVMSRSVAGLNQRADAHWWNPDDLPLAKLLKLLVPAGGKIGVPGGQAVFEYFLKHQTDAFHLTRAPHVKLPGGRKLFSGRQSAERRLVKAGLAAAVSQMLDHDTDMVLTVWHRARAAAK